MAAIFLPSLLSPLFLFSAPSLLFFPVIFPFSPLCLQGCQRRSGDVLWRWRGSTVTTVVMVVLQRFFSVVCYCLCLSLFLLLLPFLTVQVLLSTTGRTVAAGDGSGGCGRRPRWREKQREEQLLGTRKKDDFFLTFDPQSSLPRT